MLTFLTLTRGTLCAGDEQLEQRLLSMAPVLRLVPDALARAVEDLLGDLLARVRGQAVQSDGVRRRAVQQRVVDAVAVERGAALVRRVLIAHGDPDVRVDDVGALDRKSTRLNSSHPSIS